MLQLSSDILVDTSLATPAWKADLADALQEWLHYGHMRRDGLMLSLKRHTGLTCMPELACNAAVRPQQSAECPETHLNALSILPSHKLL